MTTGTSVIGMLPLVLAPGAGSELYRGLGAVVVGGLTCSTLVSLVIVPLLFSLVLDAQTLWRRALPRRRDNLRRDEAVEGPGPNHLPANAPAEFDPASAP